MRFTFFVLFRLPLALDLVDSLLYWGWLRRRLSGKLLFLLFFHLFLTTSPGMCRWRRRCTSSTGTTKHGILLNWKE